jgi:hypothetical protein
MNTVSKSLSCALLLSAAQMVMAQTPAPAPVPAATAAPPPAQKSSAQLDAGEPRANSVPSAEGDSAVQAPATPAAASTPPAATGAARSSSKSAAAPRAAGAAAPPAAQKGATAADRLNLNTATVTGDREQPKVMYVVPWKSSNIGDLSGKPMNSLLDEALAPVDRDEFKREVAYYDAINANTPQNGAANPAAKQGEK